MGEGTYEGILRWFVPVRRNENDNIDMRVYVRECEGSRSEGQPMKK